MLTETRHCHLKIAITYYIRNTTTFKVHLQWFLGTDFFITWKMCTPVLAWKLCHYFKILLSP